MPIMEVLVWEICLQTEKKNVALSPEFPSGVRNSLVPLSPTAILFYQHHLTIFFLEWIQRITFPMLDYWQSYKKL